MKNEMIKIFNSVSTIIGSILATLTKKLGIEWTLFAGFLILNIIDYITGIVKAKLKNKENSNKGLIGVVKKIGYWLLIFISFFIPFLLTIIEKKLNLGININFIMDFGWFTLVCLILNETRSILENLVEIGVKVPKFLIIGLEKYQELINSSSNKLSNNKEK